jgi:hypothetical protein
MPHGKAETAQSVNFRTPIAGSDKARNPLVQLSCNGMIGTAQRCYRCHYGLFIQ